MSNAAVDVWIVYRLISGLATPFSEMPAYKLGIIDKEGKLLKSPSTSQERDAYTLFDRVIVNLKRIIGVARLDSKFATYAAASFLVRESENKLTDQYTDNQIEEIIVSEYYDLQSQSPKTLKRFMEEIAANATGAAVAGTGDDQSTWVDRKAKGRPRYHGKAINGIAFLRRVNKRRPLV